MTKNQDKLVHLDARNIGSEPSAGIGFPNHALFGLDAPALGALAVDLGEPAWRRTQLAQAVYRDRVTDLNKITTLSKSLRSKLSEEGFAVGRPAIQQVFRSVDGTERYLVQCSIGGIEATVETVWMPEGDGGELGDGTESGMQHVTGPKHASRHKIPSTAMTTSNSLKEDRSETKRATICVSSQVGCAVNCQFCLTAKLGLQRNLSVGEIAGQVVAVLDRQGVDVGRDRINLVFMGMGEPFLNYDSFIGAVRLLVREVGLSPQRMTVSTSGIVPGIERFATEPTEFRPKLAISLNAPNNSVRESLMPINRKWNIESVVDAVRHIQLRARERITFEYVLLAGVTDQPAHAREVARLVHRINLPTKVNLIAWNPGPGIPYSMPQPEAVEAFKAVLVGEGVATYLRRPRGRDIYAACGQLKRTVDE